MKNPVDILERCIDDWNFFIREIGETRLDKQQQQIIESVQHNRKTTVRSGTARGKDYAAAWACFCFLILTPKFKNGKLVEATKVAMTAPTDRQIKNIMFPEITKIYNKIEENFPSIIYPHELKLVSHDIRTRWKEWFLTGFKADDNNVEAWSGFHAPNVMFAVTEATGINEEIFESIQGNLQGNSRLLIVFNPNITTGYAARSVKQDGWAKFKLNSLDSINVKEKKIIIPGQVDYVWVKETLKDHAEKIEKSRALTEKNDFEFEGIWYRPDDFFRRKVLGEFPETDIDTLIPMSWVEAANERWNRFIKEKRLIKDSLILGTDVAGMGNDDTVFCHRYGNFVKKFLGRNSGGVANHMETAGYVKNALVKPNDVSIIDTVGEGAGTYSRLVEQKQNVYSYKSNEKAKDLTDLTQVHEFATMRDYTYWAVRDWFNPMNGMEACLPPSSKFFEEATEIKWAFDSQGRPTIEPKKEIKKRLKRSTDYFDSLAQTFYPKQLMIKKGFNMNQISW